MSELFDRRVAVTIGPAGGEGVRLDERFNIEFLVKKTVGSELNSISCTIFGLSDDTRSRIIRQNQVIQIEVGYAEGPQLLAIGSVTRAVTEHRSPEIMTVIEAADGAKELRDTNISLSFDGPVSAQRVLDTIAGRFRFGRRQTGATAGLSSKYENGFSFSGPVRNALDSVTGKAGVGWSIQDGELQILDRFESSAGRGVLLTPDTGLIESPRKLEDSESESNRRKGAGYEVRSLLNPKIRPGESVVVRSRDVDGQFRVDSVEHSGSIRGQDWYSTAEVFSDA